MKAISIFYEAKYACLANLLKPKENVLMYDCQEKKH